MSAAPATRRAFCVLIWVLIAGVPVALLLGLGWPWWQRLHSLEESIASRTDQIQRYGRLLQTLPALKAELEQVRQNEEYKAFYFAASTPSLAGAELQRRFQDMVQAADGRLISTQLLPATSDEDPPRVRIRAQLQGDTETLLDVLFAIEQARPFLFVEQMSVRSSARPTRAVPQSRRVRRPSRTRQEGLLTVRLDVFGYTLQGDR